MGQMPNQRDKQKVLLALWISAQQIKLLDKLSRSSRLSRSQIVRNILFKAVVD
jgi:hypothetical protein